MKVLLVLNNVELKNVRIMVQLSKKKVIEQVVTLLESDREKEVFDIVLREGQVLDYYPSGRDINESPAVTLVQDTA